MGIVGFFVWITFGFTIYLIELGYRKLTISRKNHFTPEEFILYGMFGVVSVFFLLYTVLTHIQRIQQRGKHD